MARNKVRSTVRDEMMQIVDAWKAGGGAWPASTAEIAEFAVRKKLYNVPARIRMMCAKDLAKAMREDYITDSDGRPVRRLHAARFVEEDGEGKPKQRTLWDDIDTADSSFMEVAFQQRRQQIVGDCRQLNNDVNYFNSKHPAAPRPIQLCFDFTDDVAEADMPDEYQPSSDD